MTLTRRRMDEQNYYYYYCKTATHLATQAFGMGSWPLPAVSMTNECHNIGTIMEITLLASLLACSRHHPHPNIPPRNEPDDLTFLSASAISWIASFSLPEVSMLVILMYLRGRNYGLCFRRWSWWKMMWCDDALLLLLLHPRPRVLLMRKQQYSTTPAGWVARSWRVKWFVGFQNSNVFISSSKRILLF